MPSWPELLFPSMRRRSFRRCRGLKRRLVMMGRCCRGHPSWRKALICVEMAVYSAEQRYRSQWCMTKGVQKTKVILLDGSPNDRKRCQFKTVRASSSLGQIFPLTLWKRWKTLFYVINKSGSSDYWVHVWNFNFWVEGVWGLFWAVVLYFWLAAKQPISA